MSERAQALDDATMKCGLLMESAQAHQKTAEAQLEKLRVHTADLDSVVRDEIRCTLVEELQMLTAESTRAALAFRKMSLGAFARGTLWSTVVALICTCVPVGIMRWGLPSESQITALRARRDELAANVAALEARGGRIDWRRCGAALHSNRSRGSGVRRQSRFLCCGGVLSLLAARIRSSLRPPWYLPCAYARGWRGAGRAMHTNAARCYSTVAYRG